MLSRKVTALVTRHFLLSKLSLIVHTCDEPAGEPDAGVADGYGYTQEACTAEKIRYEHMHTDTCTLPDIHDILVATKNGKNHVEI